MTDDPKPQKPAAHRSATRDVRQADGGAAGVPLGDMDTESSAGMTSRGEKAANAIDNGGPSPSSATGKDEIIRGRIMEKFEELERHPASVPTDLVLAVDNGVVFIDGFVSTPVDKQTVGRLIAAVPGVRALRNNLDIAPHRPRNDEAIADAVRVSLDAVASRVQVEVRRGIVTLIGRVPDEGTRNGVLARAASVPGVRKVRDHMQPATG
jgi:osmotically-inducible protein OsmY